MNFVLTTLKCLFLLLEKGIEIEDFWISVQVILDSEKCNILT